MIKKTGSMASKSTLEALGTPVPVYVTNETANGLIGEYSMPIWIPLLVMLLTFGNAILWGGFGSTSSSRGWRSPAEGGIITP